MTQRDALGACERTSRGPHIFFKLPVFALRGGKTITPGWPSLFLGRNEPGAHTNPVTLGNTETMYSTHGKTICILLLMEKPSVESKEIRARVDSTEHTNPVAVGNPATLYSTH